MNFVSTEEKLNNILQSYNDIDAGGKDICCILLCSESPFFLLIMIISGALNKGKQKKLN